MESAPGWPRVLSYQGDAKANIPSGDHITTEMAPLVAQVYAALALSEAIMAASSDIVNVVSNVAQQLDDIRDGLGRTL